MQFQNRIFVCNDILPTFSVGALPSYYQNSDFNERFQMVCPTCMDPTEMDDSSENSPQTETLPNHEDSLIAVELGKFSYRRPKCSQCKDSHGKSLLDSKNEPWRMVLRLSAWEELQFVYGGEIREFERALNNIKLHPVHCDMCPKEIRSEEPRWVCESSVQVQKLDFFTTRQSKVHRQRPVSSESESLSIYDKMKLPVTSVCIECISKNGVCNCGICGEQKQATINVWGKDNLDLQYDTPCPKCQHPVCKFCLLEWSKRCQENGMQYTNCPFCRQQYDHYNLRRAGWVSGLRENDHNLQSVPVHKDRRSSDAKSKLEEKWKKMNPD